MDRDDQRGTWNMQIPKIVLFTNAHASLFANFKIYGRENNWTRLLPQKYFYIEGAIECDRLAIKHLAENGSNGVCVASQAFDLNGHIGSLYQKVYL